MPSLASCAGKKTMELVWAVSRSKDLALHPPPGLDKRPCLAALRPEPELRGHQKGGGCGMRIFQGQTLPNPFCCRLTAFLWVKGGKRSLSESRCLVSAACRNPLAPWLEAESGPGRLENAALPQHRGCAPSRWAKPHGQTAAFLGCEKRRVGSFQKPWNNP